MEAVMEIMELDHTVETVMEEEDSLEERENKNITLWNKLEMEY